LARKKGIIYRNSVENSSSANCLILALENQILRGLNDCHF
jgi:hypothetical protein